MYPRRPETEEYLKNVDVLTGITFYYSILLTPMPHSGPTFENSGKYVNTKKDTVQKENLILAGKTPNIFFINLVAIKKCKNS